MAPTRSIERGFDVIETLARADGAQGVSDLARVVHLDKATVHRILSVLARRGYVRQDHLTRRYVVHSRLIELSAQVLSKADMAERARPFLAEMVARTQQSAHLAVLSHETPLWIVYIGGERSPSRVQVDIRVGETALSYCTAVGKVLIAHLPRQELVRLARGGRLSSLTPHTRTTLPALEEHLQTVRAQGYAVDDQEFHRNVRCIAAPVRGTDGRVVASIGISGIVADITTEAIPGMIDVVVGVAARLSRAMGHSGPLARTQAAEAARGEAEDADDA